MFQFFLFQFRTFFPKRTLLNKFLPPKLLDNTFKKVLHNVYNSGVPFHSAAKKQIYFSFPYLGFQSNCIKYLPMEGVIVCNCIIVAIVSLVAPTDQSLSRSPPTFRGPLHHEESTCLPREAHSLCPPKCSLKAMYEFPALYIFFGVLHQLCEFNFTEG